MQQFASKRTNIFMLSVWVLNWDLKNPVSEMDARQSETNA